MSVATAQAYEDGRFLCWQVQPAWPVSDLRADLAQGFEQSPRMLPPKYFYDDYGSQLFERICETPEYYPTRAEAALLAAHATDIIDEVAPAHLIELGSGSSRKTRHLLRAAEALDMMPTYWPFDVCREMLERSGHQLAEEFPRLQVRALVGDYLGGLAHLPQAAGRQLFVFLGGTIGNFSEQEADRFLRDLRARLRPGDYLLLGADRAKDVAMLEAAYDDAAGVTAAFNLNVLNVVNRELQADFDLAGFRHRAVFNRAEARIEMYLLAQRRQRVTVQALQRCYEFEPDEAILTEISRKFTPESLSAMLGRAGFAIERHLEGGERLFSLVLAKPLP